VRRKTLHTLPKARALIADFEKAIDGLETELVSPLRPTEVETLRDLLMRIDKNLG